VLVLVLVQVRGGEDASEYRDICINRQTSDGFPGLACSWSKIQREDDRRRRRRMLENHAAPDAHGTRESSSHAGSPDKRSSRSFWPLKEGHVGDIQSYEFQLWRILVTPKRRFNCVHILEECQVDHKGSYTAD